MQWALEVTFGRAATRFGGIAALASLILVVLASGAWRHLSGSELRLHHAELTAWIARRPLLSVAAYCLACVLMAAVCLPGPGLLVLIGGVLFGAVAGGAGSLVGQVVGSLGVFLACRAASAGLLARRADGRLAALVSGLTNNAFSTLMVLRLTPVAPLSLVNIAAGLAQVRVAPFLVSGLIGAAPSNFIYAALGAGLRDAVDHGSVLDASVLATPRIVIPLVALGGLAGATALINLRRRR